MAVVKASDAADVSSNFDYQYQITGLSETPYFVRVSAYNKNGYSLPVIITGLDQNATPIPETPADQLMYMPIHIGYNVSNADVANRLEVWWTQPDVDHLGYSTTTDSGTHTPATPTYYRVELSPQREFVDSGENIVVDLRTVQDNADPLLCEDSSGGCSATIGAEIQSVNI
jgi:hypothetical protein